MGLRWGRLTPTTLSDNVSLSTGGTNHHPGNKRYRKMVEDRKLEYVNSKRLDKPLVALAIIREWRAQNPPGRFLKLNEKTGVWDDVGDKKAREKTSQALREKAPQIRKQLEEERNGKDDEVGSGACLTVCVSHTHDEASTHSHLSSCLDSRTTMKTEARTRTTKKLPKPFLPGIIVLDESISMMEKLSRWTAFPGKILFRTASLDDRRRNPRS